MLQIHTSLAELHLEPSGAEVTKVVANEVETKQTAGTDDQHRNGQQSIDGHALLCCGPHDTLPHWTSVVFNIT